MNGFVNQTSFYTQNKINSTLFSSPSNYTFVNTISSLVNTTDDSSTSCPYVEDKLYTGTKSVLLLLLVVPFHLANIISIATNKRLHQNGYFLLLNLSVSDLLVVIIMFTSIAAGVPGNSSSKWIFLTSQSFS